METATSGGSVAGEKEPFSCLFCPGQRDGKRLPMGWHRDPAGNTICASCWAERYILRAVTVPVAGPIDGEWKELREVLRVCWQTATRLSNWATRELAKADIVRTPDMDKCPKMPVVYLYGLAREQQIDMGADSQSASAILRASEAKYRACRFDTVWLGKRSLANYRYPTPYPVHNGTWSAVAGDDGQALVETRLGGRRWTLRLRGGHQFRRQLAAHAKLLAGKAVKGELAFYEQRGNGNDNRVGTKGRDDGGHRTHSKLMCKMVMWLPRPPVEEGTGTLFVQTTPAALLEAYDGKQNRVWQVHADHIRRWGYEHKAQLQRWSDDSKAEQRRRGKPASFASRRQKACEKYRHRMESATKEIASHLVKFALRRRFAKLWWVEVKRIMLPSFPWAELIGRIKTKCDEAGIEFSKEELSNDLTQ